MAIIHHDTPLAQVVIAEPTIITLLNRFGIALGVGDKTVEQVCLNHNIDPAFFVTLLNTFVNEDFLPERSLSSFDPQVLVDYLSKTNNDYRDFLLPNIERHFELLVKRGGNTNNNLMLIKLFFMEVKNEVLARIDYDRSEWFPMLTGEKPDTAPSPEARYHNDSIETKIDDLIHMFIIHLSGDYDLNLGYAVISSIMSFRKDIKMNNRIRNSLLKPSSHARHSS